jgi:hypothetical protein
MDDRPPNATRSTASLGGTVVTVGVLELRAALTKAGVPDDMADAAAHAVLPQDALAMLASKADLAELKLSTKADLAAVKTDLEVSIADLKAELFKAMWLLGIGIIAANAAVVGTVATLAPLFR